MSSSNGNSLSSGTSLFSGRPWVWVLIPLCIVLAVGAFACTFHTYRARRRKARLRLLGPGGRRALERDLEEARLAAAARRGPGPPGVAAAVPPWRQHQQLGQRWARPTTRWAWAAGLAAAATSSRPDEGLNELGEAPPPYDGKRLSGQAPKDEGPPPAVELAEVEAGGSRPAAGAEAEPAADAGAGAAEPPPPPPPPPPPEPPAYTPAGGGPSSLPEPPPPAVMHHRSG